MAEEAEGFPGVQISTFINKDQFVFRGNTGEEVASVLKSSAENIEDILTGLNSVKQAVVGKSIVTGEGANGGGTKTTTRSRGGRAADNSPPDDEEITYFEEDGVAYASVKCKHGHMLDLRGRGYKSDLYCSLDTKDYKKKCRPVQV